MDENLNGRAIELFLNLIINTLRKLGMEEELSRLDKDIYKNLQLTSDLVVKH